MFRQASLWVVAGRRVLLGLPSFGLLSFGLLLFGLPIGESRAQPSGPEIAPLAAVDRFGDALPEGVVRRFGSLRFRHAGGRESISELAFSSDGKRFASVGRDHTIRYWDAASWISIAFSADGNRLLSGGGAAVLGLRDIAKYRDQVSRK